MPSNRRQHQHDEWLDPDRFGVTETLPTIEAGTFGIGDTVPIPHVPSPPPRGSSIARNAIIVGSAFILSRILGLVREVVIAAQFGTSADYDAYVAAFRVPDLLFLVVMSGAFGSAFIPVFGGMIARRDPERAWQLASAILSYTLVALGVTAFVVLIFAEQFINWFIAPGLAPDQAELAARLTRLLLLSPLLLGLGAAFKGMLEAQDQFALSAYAPVFYNVAIVLGALLLAPSYGVYGLAFGVIAGAVLHAGVQAVGLWRGGMRLRFTLNRKVPGLSTVLRLMGPRVLGQAAFQINFIVMTNFASRIGDNSVSALNYAYQLLMLPYGVLALSLSTVIFPLMARQYETGSIADMKATLGEALGPLVFLTLPAAVGLYCFRVSIVQILFEVGSFDSQSTRLVAEALGYFAIGLAGFAVIEAVTRAFYAMQDTRTPVTVAVTAVGINVALSAILYGPMGHGGLALSISIAATVEMAVLLVILRSRIGELTRTLWSSIVRSVISALLFFPVAFWMGKRLAEGTDPTNGRSLAEYALFGYGLATAVACFFGIAFVLGATEVPSILRRLPLVGRRIMPIIEVRYDK